MENHPIDPDLLWREYEDNALGVLKTIEMDVVETVDVLSDASGGKRLRLESIEPAPEFISSLPHEARELTILWKMKFNRELTERGRLFCIQRGKVVTWYWAPNKA